MRIIHEAQIGSAERVRKRALLATTCCLLLCALVPSVATPTAATEASLPRTACAGWSDITTVRERATLVADGLAGTWERVSDVRRGRWVARETNVVYRQADGYDGMTAWSQDRSGGSHLLDAVTAKRISITEAWLVRRGWCFDRNRYTASRLRTRDGSEGFMVTPASGAAFELWFGRRDGLPNRAVLRMNENHLEINTRDWRTVSGAVFPFEQRFVDPEDQDEEMVTTRSIEVNVSLPERAFAMPEPPHDAFISGGARRAVVSLAFEAQKPIVEVMINGKGPFPFVVDTGAHLHIDADVARRLGITSKGRGNGTGQGTQISKAGFARVRELRIGMAAMRDQLAIITPYSWERVQRAPHTSKAGWLGLELFERFRVTFDVARRRLELGRLDATRSPSLGVRLPVSFDEDAPLVPCAVDGRTGPCMVDTGNAGETIIEGAWAKRVGLATRFSRGLDTHDDYRVARADVRIGPIRSRRELTEYYGIVPRGSESTTVEAAILSEGLTGAYRMTIDYADHSLWLEPPHDAPARAYTRTGLFAAKRRSGEFVVVGVLPRSSGALAGIRAGDLIIGVDDRPSVNVSSADLWRKNRGGIGSMLRLRMLRESSATAFEVPVKLADVVP